MLRLWQFKLLNLWPKRLKMWLYTFFVFSCYILDLLDVFCLYKDPGFGMPGVCPPTIKIYFLCMQSWFFTNFTPKYILPSFAGPLVLITPFLNWNSGSASSICFFGAYSTITYHQWLERLPNRFVTFANPVMLCSHT